MDGVYTFWSDRYRCVTMKFLSRTVRGVAVLYFASPRFTADPLHHFGPNVVIFQMDSGRWRWYIVGCHIALNGALTIERIVTDIGQRPCGTKLLILGNFNTYIAVLEGSDRDKDITMTLAEAGIEDTLVHFIPYQRH